MTPLDVVAFATTLERVCIETVEAGEMTKDLASLVGKQQPWLNTQDFLGKIDRNLQAAMAPATVQANSTVSHPRAGTVLGVCHR